MNANALGMKQFIRREDDEHEDESSDKQIGSWKWLKESLQRRR